ncbi:hypothetical protein D3C87_513570 [compost metagenome]
MNLKKIAEISPLIVGFLIFLGFLKLDLYYGHWNINISQYLDFSEILLSFLQDINIIFFFVVILATQSTFGYIAISSIDKKVSQNQVQSETTQYKGLVDQLEENIEKHKKVSLIAMIVLTLIFGILFWWYLKLTLLYLTFLGFVQIIAFSIDRFLSRNENVVNPITFIIVFLGFTLCISKYEINQTEKHSIQYKFTMVDGSEISTNSQLIFIGKTNNYVFLFDNENCNSKVMKTENISGISIK